MNTKKEIKPLANWVLLSQFTEYRRQSNKSPQAIPKVQSGIHIELENTEYRSSYFFVLFCLTFKIKDEGLGDSIDAVFALVYCGEMIHLSADLGVLCATVLVSSLWY